MQIYFQCDEFPYSVVINLWGHSRLGGLSSWSYQPLASNVKAYVKDFPKSLWIIDSLRLTKFDILPKITVCELYSLVLAEVDMSFKEFKFLTAPGKVSELYLTDSVIRDDKNGDVLSFEAIFECLPNINR
uniref:Uncharacterized protein n=1 Tax=Panagrolaimus sp. ES5 TaxID=591445 RepID=A0AC34FPR1_9BILA